MSITIISTSNAEKPWVAEQCQDYARRLQAPWDLQFVLIDAVKRKKQASTQKVLQAEADKMWRLKPSHAVNIVLDRTGKTFSSQAFAKVLNSHLSVGESVNFFIGGPEGVADNLLDRADKLISFSALTFPHPLVRVMLAEQVYRAWSIVHNHPYHR